MTPIHWTRRRFLQASATLMALAEQQWLTAQKRIPSAENSPEEMGRGTKPLFEGQAARPLRYCPEDGDFVIENGQEFFNRPLYCCNTPFRIDAGDKPELSLYLPGRGGNLRLGIRKEDQAKWLIQVDNIIARYRAGSMLYEIKDALLGSATLHLTILPFADTQGVMCAVQVSEIPSGTSLIWAYGGINGQKGQRGGDIGCERVPVSEFFQLQPQYCENNSFQIEGNTARIMAPVAEMFFVAPEGAKLSLGDAENWAGPMRLVEVTSIKPPQRAVLVGQIELKAGGLQYLALQRLQTKPALLPPAYAGEQIPQGFRKAQERIEGFLGLVKIDTPDAYLNAAVPALIAAADGIWDSSQQTVMHGGVAWRVPLAGWRGPYALDVLGWHDRLRAHLRHWAARQNVSSFEPRTGEPDSGKNGATKENMLHSRGDISHNHYDMNLVYVDALMRHLLWTGDVEFAREMWPVIERHLAWERRLFRRTWGEKELPLYEGYACIWASDNLQYNGGGAAHSSAYNYFQNRQAARIAELIGQDSAPYIAESDAIAKGIQQLLWQSEAGCYAESKDLLASHDVHPQPALWTYYHLVDCVVPDSEHSWLAGEQLLNTLKRIPVEGPGVPAGSWYLLSCSNWMPYVWSLNLLVHAENVHTAHALWMAGHSKEAYGLFMGALLDSMYMGLCPGNLHMTSALSVHRQEAQRDFGDAIGTTSRALIEGLFGIQPDMLEGTLRLEPRFPMEWDHASIEHRDLTFQYRLRGSEAVYEIHSRLPRGERVCLILQARTVEVESVTANGRVIGWHIDETAVAYPKIVIEAPVSAALRILVLWRGEAPEQVSDIQKIVVGSVAEPHLRRASLLQLKDPQSALSKGKCVRSGSFALLAKVRQGQMQWWVPFRYEGIEALQLVPEQSKVGLAVSIQNHSPSSVQKSATIRLHNYTSAIGLRSDASVIIPETNLLPGTNRIDLEANAKILAQASYTDWLRKIDSNRCEPVDLSSVLRERVSRIFEREYLSPRSPYCSLSIPVQAAGGWAAFRVKPNIDDSGLMAVAGRKGGIITTPQGIPLRIDPRNQNNIAFVSQWSIDPTSVTVPLEGNANHIYLLIAGSTTPQTSRMVTASIIVHYADGTQEQLDLVNPENWWPIEQDYLIDDYQFYRPGPLPPRLDLKTGKFRTLEMASFKGLGTQIDGGSATLLDLSLDSRKKLSSLVVEAKAYEPVVGLMSATLVRPTEKNT